MKQVRSIAHMSVIFAVWFIFSGILNAQTSNLLSNPSFEAGFTQLSGEQPRSVATGWTPWNVPRDAGMPSFQNTAPKYVAANAASGLGIVPRIRTGNNAQIYYSFFETHDGGLYQQISGITAGTELRFSIYAYVWSSTFSDPNASEDPGDVAVRVGIDPTGGTDATASTVVYSTPLIAYDTFREYSIIATAQASTITVFIRSSVGQPVQSSYIYLDDAVLSPTTADTTETPRPATATHTIVPPSATPIIPTATTVASQTPTTLAPSATSTTLSASNTPSPAPIVVASDTAQPASATPLSATATATPIPPTATNTNAPIVVASDTAQPASATPIPASNTPASSTGEDPTPTPESNVVLPTLTPPLPDLGEFPGTVSHVVRAGDSLASIATLYGSSVTAILSANNLPANATITVGQSLTVPVRIPNIIPPTRLPAIVVTATLGAPPSGSASATPQSPQNPQTPVIVFEYTIQRGDSLWAIAQRFNTTIATLVQINGIANPNSLRPGQRIFIPANGTSNPTQPTSVAVVQPTMTPIVIVTNVPTPTPVTTYTVRTGDSLYLIAVRNRVSIVELARINGISNFNLIFVGQQLLIPAR